MPPLLIAITLASILVTAGLAWLFWRADRDEDEETLS